MKKKNTRRKEREGTEREKRGVQGRGEREREKGRKQ